MPMVPPEIIERIRDANDIVDVINSYVPLKRAGTNFRALSPFKKEKTPSFYVSPDKQIFKCFSSGNGGDVIKFVQLYEGVSFIEAVKMLADRAAIEIPKNFTPGATAEPDTQKDVLYAIHDTLAEYYSRHLFKSGDAQIARDYLKKRGVNAETAKLFGLGYSPDSWDAGKKYLLDKGYPLELVFQAGLIKLRSKEENPRPSANPDDYYDAFRGRLMFSICNSGGRVIGFSARDLKGETAMGKYINSPESPLFKKSRELYGLSLTKRPLLDAKKAIICEGQLDLIAIYQAGFENVVASQGTAFTALHGQILKRYVDEVILCFDSDSAGVDAVIRSVDHLLEADLSVKVASIPAPEDPDSYIRTKGREQFARLLEQAKDFFDFHYDTLAGKTDQKSPAGKKAICAGLIPKVMLLPDSIARMAVLQKVAVRLGIPETTLLEQAKKMKPRFKDQSRQESSPAADDNEQSGQIDSSNRQMLHILIHHSKFAHDFFQHVRQEWIPSDLAATVLLAVREAVEHDDFQSVERSLPDDLRSGKVDELITGLAMQEIIPAKYLASEGVNLLEEVPSVDKLFQDTCSKYEKNFLQKQLKDREFLLRQGNIDIKKQMEIQKEVIDLQRRLKDITRPS